MVFRGKVDTGAEVVWPPEKQRSLLSLSQYIFVDPAHSAASLSPSLFPFLSLCCSSVCHVCFLGAALVRLPLAHAGVAYMGFMSRLCIQEGYASAVARSHYVLPR